MTFTGPQSVVDLEFTDPPQVPAGTTALNMSYTSLTLLVGVPGATAGTLTPTPVNIPAAAGTSQLELLRLQNVSQTLALTKLPNDSVIYSATFAVSSITIVVNGTAYPVSLATGTTTFTVTISNPHQVRDYNVAVFQLNPVVVSTGSGYQMIPSAVGVVKQTPSLVGVKVGARHTLTSTDIQTLAFERGRAAASISSMSASGNTTSIAVQITNAGNTTFSVATVGLRGNFVSSCSTSAGAKSSKCAVRHYSDTIWFLLSPPTPTPASGQCSTATMNIVNGKGTPAIAISGLPLSAKQCLDATFSGQIAFGNRVFVPVITSGESYRLHVIASNGASAVLACSVPFGATPCTPVKQVVVPPPPASISPISATVKATLTVVQSASSGPENGTLTLVITNTGKTTITNETVVVGAVIIALPPSAPGPSINFTSSIASGQTVSLSGTVVHVVAGATYVLLVSLMGSGGAMHPYSIRVVAQT